MASDFLDDDEEGFEDDEVVGGRLVAAPEIVDPSQRLENESDLQLGQWFWVKEVAAWEHEGRKKGEKYEWFGCVMHIGSNYVKLESPPDGRGSTWTKRVHFDEFWKQLRPETNAEQVIRLNVEKAQAHVSHLLDEVRALTARLGVVPQQQIAQQAEGGDNALAVLSSTVDTTSYKTALIEAKNKQLPDLFKQIEEGHKAMASWMAAGVLPMKAQAKQMKGVIGQIEDRLLTVSLYAGLTEEAVQCCEGAVAGMGEPLHIMQRRFYMDEECLLSYVPGGIDIRTVDQFDRWICQPEHRDRILPFPRTMVAFRVRRAQKERDSATFMEAFVNIQLAQADKTTFLYVRNGEQVWRINCDFTFGESLFPTETGLGVEPMMINVSWTGDVEMMPVREYEDRLTEWTAKKALHDEWEANNPKQHWMHNPHRLSTEFEPSKWQRFDSGSVYHDEGVTKIQAEMKQNNRLAVIVQGLFDRSAVLHPHPPVRVWEPHSFERAVTLVRDAETVVHGEAPDFEAYRREVNASLGVGSVVVGQEEVWLRREADRENTRQRNDWRCRDPRNYTRFRPYGNPGPGRLAKIVDWKPRSRKATFEWEREMRGRDSWGKSAPVSMQVDADALFNVSAYQPGDFKRFLADHRTREQYLQWAPFMLAAEDYHAGKLALGKPSKEY